MTHMSGDSRLDELYHVRELAGVLQLWHQDEDEQNRSLRRQIQVLTGQMI